MHFFSKRFFIHVKWIILLIAVATFCFSCTSNNVQKEANKDDIKVMSFNIRYGTANDGVNSWENRKQFLFDVIKNYDPDLLGIQEALLPQIQELMDRFSDYLLVGVGREDGKQAGEYSCILYKMHRFDMDTTDTFWFSDTPEIPNSKTWGNNITRICTWIRLTDRITKKKFYHYNLHLDHESQNSREKSSELLVKKALSPKGYLPIIISGDFNAGENNKAIETILDNSFKDTYRELNDKTDNEATYHAFTGKTNGERIDFIFTNNRFEVLQSDIIRANLNGKYPSDHFPVTATVRLKKIN